MPCRLTVNDVFRRSGTVGLLQGSAPLQRRGLQPPVLSGAPGEAALTRDLRDMATALRARRAFLGLRAGQVAGRCEAMTGTFVDDAALSRVLGVTRVAITAAAYAALCEAVNRAGWTSAPPNCATAGRCAGYPTGACAWRRATRWPWTTSWTGTVSASSPCRTLTRSCTAWSARGAVPLSAAQPRPRRRFRGGGRPQHGTGHAGRFARGGSSGDVHRNSHARSGRERAAHGPCRRARPAARRDRPDVIVPDMEYRHADPVEGAWMEFILAPGPVTCVSLYDRGGVYRMAVFEGESLGPPSRIEGWAHAVVRPGLGVTDCRRAWSGAA